MPSLIALAGGTISYPIDGVAYTDGGMCYAISGLTSEYDDDSTDSDFRSATMQMCRINDCVFTTGGNTWGTSPFTQKEVLGNTVANRGECYSSCSSKCAIRTRKRPPPHHLPPNPSTRARPTLCPCAAHPLLEWRAAHLLRVCGPPSVDWPRAVHCLLAPPTLTKSNP